jgi:hypothetical protein
MKSAVVVALCLSSLVGCTSPSPNGDDDGRPEGGIHDGGVALTPEGGSDASADASQNSESGAGDAGAIDAGAADAAGADAAGTDDGGGDAGGGDAGGEDAGGEDAGGEDAGTEDASSDAPAVDGGSCGSQVPEGGVCNTIVSVAPQITPTCSGGALPTGTGGTVADGTYVLKSQTYYQSGSCGYGPISETDVISGTCLQQSITFFAGATAIPFTASTVVAAQGNEVTGTVTCESRPSCHIPTSTFTATPTTLTIFQPATAACGNSASVFVYEKQ